MTDISKAEVVDKKDIYSLKLHESQAIGEGSILRVPGGWIYIIETYDSCGNIKTVSPCFVPFYQSQEDKESK